MTCSIRPSIRHRSTSRTGGETYICGNPPYLGFTWQSPEQKSDLKSLFDGRTQAGVSRLRCWMVHEGGGLRNTNKCGCSICVTNSICQGEQVPILWPLIFGTGHEIVFAHTAFKWANLASYNAGVTVAVIGIANRAGKARRLYSVADDGTIVAKDVEQINAYLVPGPNVIVEAVSRTPVGRAPMVWGNKPSDGGNLILSLLEAENAVRREPFLAKFIFDFVGSQELVKGIVRKCIWIEDADLNDATCSNFISERLGSVRAMRMASAAESTQAYADKPHRFRQIQGRSAAHSIVVPR